MSAIISMPALAKMADRANQERKNRLTRADYLPIDLFGETGWDILLSLCARLGNNDADAVSVILNESTRFQDTGRRWLDHLRSIGLVETEGEGNTQTVSLTNDGRFAMHNYLMRVSDQGF